MATVEDSNEGKACDAILRHIEARDGHARSELSFPEKAHDVGPVELVCKVGPQLYAIEHTRIEPFAGHIQVEKEFERHFKPLMEMVGDQLPADDRFELHLPFGALSGKHDRDVRPIHEALAAWIIATAPTLPVAGIGRVVLPVQKVSVPGVPFTVSLHRWKRNGFPVPFHVVHLVKSDVEPERLARIEAAYDKKLGKLLKWKARGARTVLILEEDDIQLTNHFRVGDALIAIEATRTERPDEVYLLSTGVSVWFAVPLRVGDTSFYDLELEQRYWETGPDKLDNITGARRPAKPPAA